MKREVQNHAEVIKKLHRRRRRMWQQPMSSGADCVGQGSAGAVLSSRDRFDEKAASVAGMILTTECALVDIKEETPPAPPMGGGGMPGMM